MALCHELRPIISPCKLPSILRHETVSPSRRRCARIYVKNGCPGDRFASTHNHNVNMNYRLLRSISLKPYLQSLNTESLKNVVKNFNYVAFSKRTSGQGLTEKTSGQKNIPFDETKPASHKLANALNRTDHISKQKDLPEEHAFKTQPLYKIYGGRLPRREQHDFHQAMMDKFDSITSYHTDSNQEGREERVTSVDTVNTSTRAVNKPSSAIDSPPCAVEKNPCEKLRTDTSYTVANSCDSEVVTTPEVQVDESWSGYIKGTFSNATEAVRSASESVLGRERSIPKTISKMIRKYRKKAKTLTSVKVSTLELEGRRVEGSSRKQLEKRALGLARGVIKARSDSSRSLRLEELCIFLVMHPEFRSVVLRSNIVPVVMKLKYKQDATISGQAREALALLGVVEPPGGRGVRILSLDGGGTRGLKMIETLKSLEKACGRPLHEVFDLMCGVSTGGLVAILLSVFRVPLDDCEEIYRHFSSLMFSQNKLIGTGKLVMSHAYYDAQLWEDILKEHMGLGTFLDSTHDPLCPKVALVSNIFNPESTENFVFRNYTLPVGMLSHFKGDIKYPLWQAIRASSAAPGYYEEFILDEHIHLDGGVMTNNPTAIAIHEAKHLWPKEPIQCVVSVGTGRYIGSTSQEKPSPLSLKEKVSRIVQSATGTEDVHLTVQDFLPPTTYFRFNPYMSEEFLLDEVNPEKWQKMIRDTQLYCRKNERKFNRASERLAASRTLTDRAKDWLNEQIITSGYYS